METDDDDHRRGTKRPAPESPPPEPGAYLPVSRGQHLHQWKRLRETSTGEAVPSLPFEILVAILRFLDIRSAMREARFVSRAFSEAALEAQRLFRSQRVFQADDIAVTLPFGQYAFSFAHADGTVFACESTPDPVSHALRCVLLGPPYAAADPLLSFDLVPPFPKSSYRRPCYLGDYVYLFSIEDEVQIVVIRETGTGSFAYETRRPEEHYGEKTLRLIPPQVQHLLLAYAFPKEEASPPIASLLRKRYFIPPTSLPGVGSLIVFPDAAILATAETAFWLGPGSTKIYSEEGYQPYARPRTAGSGILIFVSSWYSMRREGRWAGKFTRMGVILEYSPAGGEGRLSHLLTVHYPSQFTTISAAYLLQRYLLITPVAEDAPSPGSQGKVYLYDTRGKGEAIHVFRLPSPVSALSIDFLHAAGSTLVAFCGPDSNAHYLKWAVLYPLLNREAFTVNSLEDEVIGTISMASRGFVFTTTLGMVLWYRVAGPPATAPALAPSTESGEETQLEGEEQAYNLMET